MRPPHRDLLQSAARGVGCLLLLCASSSPGQDCVADIEYARIGDRPLRLDIYRPDVANPPLVIYVHGGAWRAGSKSDAPVSVLTSHGFAVASVDYRLSVEAEFPAPIHDIKAAIRFLRAKAGMFGIDAKRIGIIGSSAGGHLAALVGVTNRDKVLEGQVGDHVGESSDVCCIISLFGASNLQSILSQSTQFGLKVRVPALQLLLGGQPSEKPDLARLASPVAHLDASDPPLLLIHGDADPQMPLQQSEELAKAYLDRGLSVNLVIMTGSKHGGKEFYDAERILLMSQFLKAHLRPHP